MMVQLIGRASPEGSKDYNLRLGARRAGIIVEALERAGINRSRIVDPPGAKLEAGCSVLNPGLITCGEAGATGPADRQVAARIFSLNK